MPDLKQRTLQPELMDDLTLGMAEHEIALRGLARVHLLTRTAARLWHGMRPLLHEQGGPLSVLDVGCGDGLLLRQLHRKAHRRGHELELHGCDFNAQALEITRGAAAAERVPLQLHRLDITRNELPQRVDIIICSLFLHHFSDNEVIKILKQFSEKARRLVLIEDLVRSRLGYYLCWLGIHTLSRSRVVHVDGLLSVRAAFTVDEIRSSLVAAGMQDANIQNHWPERFLIRWAPSSETDHGG